jgi:hypothetical protein
MRTILPFVAMVTFGAGVVLSILAGLFVFCILEGVNQKRVPGDHISRNSIRVKVFELVRLNKELYPESRKRAVIYLCLCLGAALFCFALTIFSSIH